MKGCKDSLLYFSELKNKSIDGKLEFVKVVEKFEADYDVSKNLLKCEF